MNVHSFIGMEIYYAVSAFDAPQGEGSENILSFDKGDKFEIYDCHKNNSEWWGARALKDSCVGYVPSKYMKVCLNMNFQLFYFYFLR